VEASDDRGDELTDDAAVATVGASPILGTVETKVAGVLPEDDGDVVDVPAGVSVEGVVTGCGHEESALPPRAACRPHTVSGAVTAVPGAPVDVDVGVVPVPVQLPPALPLSAAETAQTETGAKTGMDPAGVVDDT
jgi:hypothetical protein